MNLLPEIAPSGAGPGEARHATPSQSENAAFSSHDVTFCNAVRTISFDQILQETNPAAFRNFSEHSSFLKRSIAEKDVKIKHLVEENNSIKRIYKNQLDTIHKAAVEQLKDAKAPREQTIREQKEKIRELEDKNDQIEAEARELKQALKETQYQQTSQLKALEAQLQQTETELTKVQKQAKFTEETLKHSTATVTQPLAALSMLYTLTQLLPCCSICEETIDSGSPWRHYRIQSKDKVCSAYFHPDCIKDKLRDDAGGSLNCQECGDLFYTKEVSGNFWTTPAKSVECCQDKSHAAVISQLATIRKQLPIGSTLRTEIFKRKSPHLKRLLKTTLSLSNKEKKQP